MGAIGFHDEKRSLRSRGAARSTEDLDRFVRELLAHCEHGHNAAQYPTQYPIGMLIVADVPSRLRQEIAKIRAEQVCAFSQFFAKSENRVKSREVIATRPPLLPSRRRAGRGGRDGVAGPGGPEE